MPTPDWPDAPCYGCAMCTPSMEKQREDWAPYYQYKGVVWMEMMKTQMIEAMKNGTLEDWVTGNQSNYDAWNYYYLNNQAPFFRSSVSGLNDEHPYFPPPLQQLTTGIVSKDVACKKGLNLVIKAEDGSPACVKIETGKVLVKRGWATTFGTGISTNEYYTSCDTPYPKSNTGVAVLYMPVNSIGKICVKYSNGNDFPVEPMYGISVVDPNNSYQKAKGITIWNDLVNNPILKGNSTVVVYWIKTENQTGFYELSVSSCGGTPFAVGYDNDSKIVSHDFPFVGVSISCPVILYSSDIYGLTGIGVKYIPYP